jgi:hypothetical protein
MFGQEPIKGSQLLRNAFDIVQTVDSKNDFLTLEVLSQFFQFSPDAFRFHFLSKVFRFDADRETVDDHFPIGPMQVGR